MRSCRIRAVRACVRGVLLLTSATSSLTAMAVPSDCPAVVDKWPAASGNPITAIVPMTIYDGSVTTFRVTGTNLQTSWTVQLCPSSGTSVSADDLPTTKPGTSSTSALEATLVANPGAAGDYSVYIIDAAAGKVYDSGKKLTITSSEDTRYVACSAPASRGKPNANLACSFVPFSHETALEVFGKGVANRFIAVQVTVRNKNSNLEYLLQDIRVGQPGFVLSSYDKRIPRAVSEKEEQFSTRAIVIRLTAAAASVVTGVAGFAGNVVLQDAANIFAGPAQTGLQSAIPNLSASELTRMDDLGFSITSTVIPKNSAIAVVAFIPSDTEPTNYSKLKGDHLKALFSSLTVSVAGTHVQEANPSQPTLKLFIPASSNSVALTAFKSGSTSLIVQGSGLDGVKQVQLSNTTDGKTVLAATLKPLPNESTIDPNVALLSIPAATNATPGIYNITFVLADGTSVKTGQSVTVTSDAPTLSPTHGAVNASVLISGSGFGASEPAASTVTFGGVPAPVTKWTDTQITATVPSGAPATSPVIVTIGGVPSAAAAFTVP